jgi:hypothetical protein
MKWNRNKYEPLERNFMQKLWIPCLIGALALSAQNVSGQLVTYDFQSPADFSPDVSDSNMSATSISDGGAHQLQVHNQQLRSFNWTTSSSIDTSTSTEYFSFTVTPDSGWMLNLDTIQFDYDRGNQDDSVRQYDVSTVRTSTGLVQQGTGSYTGVDPVTDETVNLSNLQNVTESVEFRIFNFDADTATGSEFINHDNIGVFGSVTAVPEPSHYAAAFGVLLIGFAAFRRYRRQGAAA